MELKELRLQKGLTQVEAAIACNVSVNTWQLWERKVTTPSSKNEIKIKKLWELPDKAG